MSSKPAIPFHPKEVYHLIKHANAYDNLYEELEDYDTFLERYVRYMSVVVDTFAYCLMPNHFHFLVQVKSKEELYAVYRKKMKLAGKQVLNYELIKDDLRFFDKIVKQQYSNFLNSYAKIFNDRQKNRKRGKVRQGKLFKLHNQPLRITDREYCKNVVRYIHFNPVHHGFRLKPEDWAYSSYHVFFHDKPTFMDRNKVKNVLFGKSSLFSFEEFHKNHPSNFDDFNNLEDLEKD